MLNFDYKKKNVKIYLKKEQKNVIIHLKKNKKKC